ncbi:DUF4199 domain-containing protein [Fulvivirgaceae bacterium BMA10]|uniref:DUF4199 domain-containing protein n=1 Tax=Splendidivirga corallicola TaxID=3051826 RepID=A0ABT8KN09_9BACT|nr:DUF4199 domain-containing protein [Fulvivirgaceae bacterium BMA10]
MKTLKILTDKHSMEGIAFKYGLLTFGGLLVFFLIMKFVGLVHIVELRSLNFLIMITGVWFALKTYEKEHSGEMIYFRGLGLGALTTVFAVIPFALFLFIYLQFDQGFMLMIRQHEMFGQYLNPYIVSFLIAFEGSLSGFFIAFTLMQYMKKKYPS